MIRRETFCDGRLVKEIDQVNVMSAARPYHYYVDGQHTWLLDGAEVTEAEAKAFRAVWEAEQRGGVR